MTAMGFEVAFLKGNTDGLAEEYLPANYYAHRFAYYSTPQ
jgi:hypothetical protein